MAQEIVTEVVEVKLPKLKVAITRAGDPLRMIEVDDPRELLIRNFNQCSREMGLEAKPA